MWSVLKPQLLGLTKKGTLDIYMWKLILSLQLNFGV